MGELFKGNDDSIGGIVGQLSFSSKVEDCNNSGQVIGKGDCIGGVVGVIHTDGNDPSDKEPAIVSKCYNSENINGNNCTGGVIGGATQYKSLTKKCYNLGEVNGTGTETGGILGKNNNLSTIDNSYYLEGTADLDEGSGSANDLAKNKEYITQDFVTTANATETIWKVESGKNDGWPILNE